MTQNVVDGFGAAGVDGPVRRCSEITLRVLRDSKEALTQVTAEL
jgi:phosphatidylinositol kinase/protein kinase (PI-3  family)